MSRVPLLCGVVLFYCHIASPEISRLAFDPSRCRLPTDSLSYSCASDRESLTTTIFLETGSESSGLDTATDLMLYSITMIDNFFRESWHDDRGIIADNDPIRGKFSFAGGCPGLPPGSYRLLLHDGSGSATTTFRICPFDQPYRRITGHVIPPAGADIRWNSVALGSAALPFSLGGWTDSTGAFDIGIDESTINRCGGRLKAYVESRFNGFAALPAFIQLDASVNNWNEVNFTFVALAAQVRGTILSANMPAENIPVLLLDSAGAVLVSSASGPDGCYTVDAPAGRYRIALGGDDTVTSTAYELSLAPGDTITRDLQTSDGDYTGTPAPGRATLRLTVIDSTLSIVNKGAIMIWDARPQSATIRPLRVFPLQKFGEPLALVELPSGQCRLSVELSGIVLGSSCRYSVFAADPRGSRRIFDFSSHDTLVSTITIRETDRVGALSGRGSIRGTVAAGALTHAPAAIVLYDVDRNTVERGGNADKDGTFQIDHIYAGAYRVAAAIDTNGDKLPDATAMADTLLVVTGAESFSGITIAFSEKPAGTLRITGRINGISVIPDSVLLTVAALPVDTLAPPSKRFGTSNFMAAYRAPVGRGGVFTISDLPRGVYYVVAAAEKKDIATGRTDDIAWGVYGDLLIGGRDDEPFTPRAVVLDESSTPRPIDISLIMRGSLDGESPVSGSRLRIPAEFALQSARLSDAGGSAVRVEFAVPRPTMARFSVDDIAGRSLAASAEALFAPGFHQITVPIDRSIHPKTTPLFIAMQGDDYHARMAVTPAGQQGCGSEASSMVTPIK